MKYQYIIRNTITKIIKRGISYDKNSSFFDKLEPYFLFEVLYNKQYKFMIIK